MLSLQRLLLGGEGAEFSVRARARRAAHADQLQHQAASTQGSAARGGREGRPSRDLRAARRRAGLRAELRQNGIDYERFAPLGARPGDRLSPASCDGRAAPARHALHFVRSDGTVAMLVFDKLEQVICWLEIETDGVIEDVVVLPGDAGVEEDASTTA
jgi:hypothetical protein